MMQLGVQLQELANDFNALFGMVQVVQAEFEKGFAGVRFLAGVIHQLRRYPANRAQCRCGGMAVSAAWPLRGN